MDIGGAQGTGGNGGDMRRRAVRAGGQRRGGAAVKMGAHKITPLQGRHLWGVKRSADNRDN